MTDEQPRTVTSPPRRDNDGVPGQRASDEAGQTGAAHPARSQGRVLDAASRRRRVAAARREAERRERRRQVTQWVAIAAAALVLAAGIVAVGVWTGGRGHSPTAVARDVATGTLTGPTGPEGVALEEGTPIAPASTAATGQTVDGIRCETREQIAYHVHAHLTIYVDGVLRPLPPGVGIVSPINAASANAPVFDAASRCYYWLHTHAQDGVIHIEAPTETTYTLGDFFALWNQPLATDQVGSARGRVTAYLDGKPFAGSPARIPLTSHADIQLDLGTDVAAKKVDWSASGL
jgi:hypothetical protein